MKPSLTRPALALLLTFGTGVARAVDYPNEVLADNPLVYYRLNDPVPAETALNTGSAGAAANGSYLNGVLHRQPGALAGDGAAGAGFPGGGARVAIPFTPALNPPASSPFTIEAWVKPTIEGAGNAQCPLFNRHTAGNRQGWVFFQRTSGVGYNFRMYNQNGSTQSVDITGGTYTVGQWSHLVAVWNGTTATLYVNGVLAGTQTAGYVANTDAPLSIGAYGADNPGDNAFTGSVDDVAFYPSALSAATVLSHYTNGVTATRTREYSELVKASSPTLYLQLDDAAPGTDVVKNSGSLGPETDALGFPGQKRGIPGALAGSTDTATGFTGINQVSCNGAVPTILPFRPELNTSTFTVEAWVRPDIDGNSNAQCPFFNRTEGAARRGWIFYQRGATSGANGKGWNFRMYNGVDTNRSIDLTSDDGYVLGNWYHLVATFDGTTGSLYVNGVLRASQAVNGSYAPNTDSVFLSAGGFPSGIENPFVGGIDEVALYSSALTATQVLTHYQNGVNPNRVVSYPSLVQTDGALEYLRLNEPPYLPAANAGSLGGAAQASYVNVTNTASGPQAPDYMGFETVNPAAPFSNNSYLELGNPAELNFAGTISVEAWITPGNAQQTDARIISHGANKAGTGEVALRIFEGNYQFGSGVTRASVSAAEDIATGAKVHLAGTYDGANWNLFRNGVLVASTPDAQGAPVISDANWAVGARGRWEDAANYPASGQESVFNGTIDEVAIYRQALTPERVTAHYIAGVAGVSPLTISRTGGVTRVTWTKGTLQHADDTGTFTDVPGATSPYTAPAGTRKFYRLRF